MARLYSTSYTAAEVADGLGVNDSRVRQRRLAHTLWAIDDGGTWVYPAVQFELVDAGCEVPSQRSELHLRVKRHQRRHAYQRQEKPWTGKTGQRQRPQQGSHLRADRSRRAGGLQPSR